MSVLWSDCRKLFSLLEMTRHVACKWEMSMHCFWWLLLRPGKKENLFYYFFVKGGYGFNIKGGRDKPFREGDTCVYITRLRPGAAAEKDGRLSPGDRIVEVLDISLFAHIVCTPHENISPYMNKYKTFFLSSHKLSRGWNQSLHKLINNRSGRINI